MIYKAFGAVPGDERGLAYALKVSGFYAALFLVYGFHLPYFPLWLSWKGLDERQIAIITAAPFFLRLAVTPFVAMAADRSSNYRGFILALAFATLAATAVLTTLEGFLAILAVGLVFAISTMTIMPLTETVAIGGVKDYALDYGRMRLWGSIVFILVGAAGGALITAAGAWTIIWVLVLSSALVLLAAYWLPSKTHAGDHVPGSRLNARDLSLLVRSKLFLAFLFAAGAVQAAHAMFYTFGALHWSSLGISPTWTGVLWAVAVFVEVILFAYSALALRVTGITLLLLSGAGAAIVRWTVMAFDPPLALLFPLQVLHALTYGATHLAAIHFIHRAVPPSVAGTAQALYATVAMGVMMGAATLACGPVYTALKGQAYLSVAVLSLAGFVAALFVHLRWKGDMLWTPGDASQQAR